MATVTAVFHQQVKYRATPRGHRYGKPQFHEALAKKVASLHGFPFEDTYVEARTLLLAILEKLGVNPFVPEILDPLFISGLTSAAVPLYNNTTALYIVIGIIELAILYFFHYISSASRLFRLACCVPMVLAYPLATGNITAISN